MAETEIHLLFARSDKTVTRAVIGQRDSTAEKKKKSLEEMNPTIDPTLHVTLMEHFLS